MMRRRKVHCAKNANAARRLRERAPLYSCWLMYEEKRVDVGRHVRKHASALLPHNDDTRPKHRFHSVQASPLLSPTFKPLNCMSGPEFWAPSMNRAEVGASAFAVQRGSAIHAGMELECSCGSSCGSTGGSIEDERRWVQPRETKRAPRTVRRREPPSEQHRAACTRLADRALRPRPRLLRPQACPRS